MHNVNEATMHFFRDFESDMKAKQSDLVLELKDEIAREKVTEKAKAREVRKREAGYVRM